MFHQIAESNGAAVVSALCLQGITFHLVAEGVDGFTTAKLNKTCTYRAFKRRSNENYSVYRQDVWEFQYLYMRLCLFCCQHNYLLTELIEYTLQSALCAQKTVRCSESRCKIANGTFRTRVPFQTLGTGPASWSSGQSF